jgi:hypothetical protein
MTNKNYHSRLRTIAFDFGCGFGLGLALGILGYIKGGDSLFPIIICGLFVGVLSAIFGRSFWRFLSKRKVKQFSENTNHDVKKNSNNELKN